MGFLGSALKQTKPFWGGLTDTQLLFYANSILAPVRTASLAPGTPESELDFAFPSRPPRDLRARAPCPPPASDAERRERGQLSAWPPPASSYVTGGRDPSRLRLIELRKSVKKMTFPQSVLTSYLKFPGPEKPFRPPPRETGNGFCRASARAPLVSFA